MQSLENIVHRFLNYLNGCTIRFHLQTQRLELLIKYYKQYYRTVPLSSFHFNGDTLGFNPQS